MHSSCMQCIFMYFVYKDFIFQIRIGHNILYRTNCKLTRYCTAFFKNHNRKAPEKLLSPALNDGSGLQIEIFYKDIDDFSADALLRFFGGSADMRRAAHARMRIERRVLGGFFCEYVETRAVHLAAVKSV